MGQYVKTSLGLAVILIIAFTAGFFAWKAMEIKNQPLPVLEDNVQVENIAKKKASVTDWKNYKNETYGYEMKYPSDWSILTLRNVEPTTFSAPDFRPQSCFAEGAKICPRLMVGNIHEIEKGETIKSDINLNTNDRLIAEKAMKISGEDASLIEYYQGSYGRRDGGMGLLRQEMKVIHNGTMYRIYVQEYNADINKIKTSADWEYEKVFEEMVNSFKFLN